MLGLLLAYKLLCSQADRALIEITDIESVRPNPQSAELLSIETGLATESVAKTSNAHVGKDDQSCCTACQFGGFKKRDGDGGSCFRCRHARSIISKHKPSEQEEKEKKIAEQKKKSEEEKKAKERDQKEKMKRRIAWTREWRNGLDIDLRGIEFSSEVIPRVFLVATCITFDLDMAFYFSECHSSLMLLSPGTRSERLLLSTDWSFADSKRIGNQRTKRRKCARQSKGCKKETSAT